MYQCLIMELTQEQGGNRQSQVQPPLAVWEHFFGVTCPRSLVQHYESRVDSIESTRSSLAAPERRGGAPSATQSLLANSLRRLRVRGTPFHSGQFETGTILIRGLEPQGE